MLLLLYLSPSLALDNGLGKTPQMGWNSWNRFQCNINEALIKRTADKLVALGLDKKGYRYVNLDDCWQVSRDPKTQRIQPGDNFPSGMKPLAEYIHGKGLLFGLYSDSGTKTCAGRPGSLGYEEIDAKTYAEWEADYLKYDNCNSDKTPAKTRYERMRDALNKTGRPIFFSLCNWGEEQPWVWGNATGNSWRTTFDIRDSYQSFVSILDQNVKLAKFSGPGGWNDPDMLEVGNGGMTTIEYQSHFALWAILKAPLLIGCDLDTITPENLAILSNE
jgi:alpha-galactosidase